MAKWYVRRGEKVIGPVEIANLREAAAAGTLLPTDQLSNDAGGPWTQAGNTTLFAKQSAQPPRPEPAGGHLVPKVEHPLTQDAPPDGDDDQIIIFRAMKVFVVKVGHGAVAAGGTVARFLSTRAQRRRELKVAEQQRQHELELARIHADSQRPQAAVGPTGPVILAPQMVQNTVVKVVQNSGGCGCSGCAWAILLLLIVLAALVALVSTGVIR